MANFQSSSQWYLFGWFRFGGAGLHRLRLFVFNSGFTQLSNVTEDYTANTDTNMKLTTKDNGANKDLEGFVDGVSKTTASTGTKYASGRSGIYTRVINHDMITDWWTLDMGLSISSVNPSFGEVGGGDNIVINGTDIGDGTLVDFGGIPPTGVVVTPNNKIDFVNPPGNPGFVDVTIKFGTLGSEEYISTVLEGYKYVGRVNQAFLDAQNATTAEMKKELKAFLRNQAASAEGSSATGDDLDADHPASGAIDSDATHLNFGPAATAENGLGKGGWKSSDASLSNVETLAADWNGGTQTNIKTINDAIETAFDTSRYEQDFDGLTSGSALATQDGWVVGDAPESGNFINVESATGFGGGGKGVRILNVNTGFTDTRKAFTPGTKMVFSFRLKEVTHQQNVATVGLQINFKKASLANVFLMGFFKDQEIQAWDGSWQRVVTGKKVTNGAWHRFVISMDRTTVASTKLKIFMDGEQIHEDTVDTTDLANVSLSGESRTNLDLDFHFDDLRIGDNLEDNGQQENVFDLGADAVNNGRAELSFNGEAERVERFVSGAFYGVANDSSDQRLKELTSRQELAQTFEVDSDSEMTSVQVYLAKTGTPAPAYKAVISLEIRDTTGGTPVPGTIVYGRSVEITTSSISSGNSMVKFEFPTPVHLKSGIRYALVLDGKYDTDASNHVTWQSDVTAPGYANGSAFRFNDDTVVWDSIPHDFIFVLTSHTEAKALYADTNQDAKLDLRTGSSTNFQAQGFKVANDIKIQHAKIYVEKVGTLPANSTIWWELFSDDGAGKPNARLVEGVHQDANAIDWTAFRHYVLALPREFQAIAGTQYHMVLRGNWVFSGTNFLRFGVDNSAASYADGSRNTGDDADPTVWTTTSTSDMIFAILGIHKPFIRFDVAFSTDDITYGSFNQITDNPGQAGSLSGIAFTGEKKRFYKTRANLERKITGGEDEPWTPILSDYTVKAIFRTRKQITVDFGQNRVIRGVEIYAHPTEHGVRQVLLEHALSGGGPFTTITAFEELSARRKGGAASTPVNAAGSISTDGDYLRIILDANITMRFLKVYVQDNDDEFARIMEVKAFRVEDWTDRWVNHSEQQSGDPLFRRVNGKDMTIGLRNDDGFLSAKRTDGGFNDEVGPGVRLFPKIGYEGGATLVPRGVFYVEKWPEQIRDPVIKVKSRDGTKLMNTQIRAKLTVSRRIHELIEYLGNLCGIASTDMNLDQTTDSVDFYLGKELNAYQEAQKLAEAVAFSQLFFDEEGYLRFRVTGNSQRDMGLHTQPALSGPSRVFGPPSFVGDKMYILISDDAGGGNEDMHLFEWDIADAIWTDRGVIQTSAKRILGTLIVFDEKIYMAIFESFTENTKGKLYRYDPETTTTTVTMELLPEFSEADFDPPGAHDGLGATLDEGLVPLMVSELVHGHKWIIGCRSIRGKYENKPYEIDLFGLRDEALSNITGWQNSNDILQALKIENEKLVVGTWTVNGSAIRMREWDYDKKTLTEKLGFPDIPSQVRGHMMMAGAGDGTLWLIQSERTGGDKHGAILRLLDVTADTWTIVDTNQIDPDGGTLLFHAEGQGLAFADGLIFAYWGKLISPGKIQHRIISRDLKAPNVISTDGGPLAAAGTGRIGQFASHTDVNGVTWIYGIMDNFRTFEVRVRGLLENQTTAIKVISEDSEGLLRELTADRTDEAGGKAAIMNLVTMKSQPLIAEPDLEQVWQAKDLPWGLTDTGFIEFDIELKEACDPGTVAFKAGHPVFANGAAGAATLKDVIDGGSVLRSTNRVRISIDVTDAGTITDLVLEGKPLKRQGTLIATSVGDRRSRNRFNIREFERQNNYIQNPMNLLGLAKSLTDRYEFPKQVITGMRCLALWDLRFFDRTKIVAATLGIDGDYYITGIAGSFEDPDMTIDAIEI